MPSVLAYWDIRGLAQPIRLLLNYVGEEFEDRYYSCGPAPDFKRDSWLDVKFTLGLDFPNLPYYMDGDVKITQSSTIMRHIGRKYNLLGSKPQEVIRVDQAMEEIADFRAGFTRTCYNPNFKNLKPTYLENAKTKLKQFENFLGNNNFFAGENITIADFNIYEMLDQHRIMEPTILADFPKLQAFVERFEALPQVKKYMESDKFMKWPLNNKMAGFGAAEPEEAKA